MPDFLYASVMKKIDLSTTKTTSATHIFFAKGQELTKEADCVIRKEKKAQNNEI